jgi:hypothetical protein
MTAEADAAAERELQRQYARWMADTRLRVERVGKHWDVHCSGCGTRLTFGGPELKARGLAIVNATARPCCNLWIVPPLRGREPNESSGLEGAP